MLDSASLIADDWSGLISRIAGDLDLDALAKETRALVRRRGVPDAQALLRLALARGPGGMSLRQTSTAPEMYAPLPPRAMRTNNEHAALARRLRPFRPLRPLGRI